MKAFIALVIALLRGLLFWRKAKKGEEADAQNNQGVGAGGAVQGMVDAGQATIDSSHPTGDTDDLNDAFRAKP